MTEFHEYELHARLYDPPLTDDSGEALILGGLGLAGEAGEVVDLIKKNLYHNHPLDRMKIIHELGDVLWYLSFLAAALDTTLKDIAEQNLAKLARRYPNGFTFDASINRDATPERKETT